MSTSYEITVNDYGTYTCGRGESLLHAFKRTNYNNSILACFGGGCGKCLIRVHEGSYEIIQKMSKAHVDGSFKDEVLACSVRPMSNMVITLLKK